MSSQTAPPADEIVIRVLPTPNPFALKFIVNTPVKDHGKATFNQARDTQGVRLAEDLFQIAGVRQLHFFENVVTVTHESDTDPTDLRSQVQSVLKSRLPVHDANFVTSDEMAQKDRSGLPPEIQAIEEILDQTVRMYLQSDGGDIEVVRLEGNQLEVRYQGACGTCPSSTAATLEGIQGILRDQFDPNIEVVPVS